MQDGLAHQVGFAGDYPAIGAYSVNGVRNHRIKIMRSAELHPSNRAPHHAAVGPIGVSRSEGHDGKLWFIAPRSAQQHRCRRGGTCGVNPASATTVSYMSNS